MLGKFLCNQKGDISVAVLVSVVALASGLSLSLVAGRDSNAALYQYDQVQELSLIRSEIRRGYSTTSNIPSSSENYTLPFRYVQVSTGTSRTTYALKTQVGRQNLPGGMQHYTRRAIATKVKAFRRPARLVTYHGTANKSPIEAYGVKTIQKQTFAGYMYLSNTDESVNDDPVYFYGKDEIWGRVHSNTDIWCQQTNNPAHNWPLFHDHVSTGGIIRYDGGTPDPDELFLDGYTEHAGEIEFNPTADLIRRNGGTMWPVSAGWNIAYVELQGATYQAYRGTFTAHVPAVDTLIVYNLYPPYGPVGDSINVNYIAFRDTIWSESFPGSIVGSSRMVEAGELWIRGACAGEQTWGSAGNMMLVDDLYYTHTTRGEAPDASDGGRENLTDFLGLVSEKQILLKYGFYDWRDSTRHHYYAEGETPDGIYIYAAMAALGDGQGDSHQDGIFSFEYQYPHYSTPSGFYQGERFEYPDLHLGKWEPQAPAHYWPWPARGGGGYSYAGCPDANGPDYPWYNPLWPEENPYLERGLIHLYGSVAQVRRGFVHRGGDDPLDTGWWDPEHYRYGAIPVFGQNAPGASGLGIGYNKDYHYDYRFMEHPPVDFPEVNIVGKEGLYEEYAVRFMRPPSSF